MNKVVKNTIKIAAFMLLFVFLFLLVQDIFIEKAYDTIMYAQFYNEPKDSLDVLILGSSMTRASVLPAVLWEEAGIASYNLGGQGTPDEVAYYTLKEALRYQSPSVVVVTAWFIFAREGFDENEMRFRRAFNYMPMSATKLESISEIIDNSETQRFVDYVIPFFRYHNRRDITGRDFDLSFKVERNEHMRVLRKVDTIFRALERPDDFDDPEYVDPYNIRGEHEYLDRIIALCKSEGIEVVLIMSPTCEDDVWSMPKHDTMQEYADEHGVVLLDFNMSPVYCDIGLDESTDYYNALHTNMSGGTKVSRYLAAYLAENFALPDRRGTGYDPHWDAVVEAYYEQYNILLHRIEEGMDRGAFGPEDIVDGDGDVG